MSMGDTHEFDFEWQTTIDDELRELEDYLFLKITTAEENDILRSHAGEPTDETAQQLRKMAGRYQRGELGELLPVTGPLLPEKSSQLAADFFRTIGEQDDDNVLLMYRLAKGWADHLGIEMPTDARPLDEQPLDLIEIERPWPEMSSNAIH